jgi:hypothetical protein
MHNYCAIRAVPSFQIGGAPQTISKPPPAVGGGGGGGVGTMMAVSRSQTVKVAIPAPAKAQSSSSNCKVALSIAPSRRTYNDSLSNFAAAAVLATKKSISTATPLAQHLLPKKSGERSRSVSQATKKLRAISPS